MKQLWLTARLDIVESLRARWFQIYTLVFGGIVALLFLFGLTESRVLGFIGLSREGETLGGVYRELMALRNRQEPEK